MNLPTRKLGSSDLHITRVGVGTAPIGSTREWSIYWGPQDQRDTKRTTLRETVDREGTVIDEQQTWIYLQPICALQQGR